MALNFSSLSGGTSFTVVTSTGGSKTATLDKSYPAGTYLIESKAMDTNLEVYLGASDGTQVGSATAGAKTITASSSFIYVTTVNADANDAVIFTLKSASTLATKTDAVWAPPTITDITPSGLPNLNNTTTITGTNFATNVDVKFRKSDDSTLVTPKSTVRGSATSIIATRPDSFAPGDAPYDVIVTNPTTNLAATSLNAITAGAVPVWVTSTTLNAATLTIAFSQTIQATDADGGSSITYAIVSGALPTGLSLNTSTGAITGTPSGSTGTYTVTISATDSGGNAVNRTFTQALNPNVVNSEILIIAGGGGNYTDIGGGGGAGGLVYASSVDLNPGTTYSVTVGGGGASNTNGSGTNSTFSGSGLTTITALGGGNAGAAGGGSSPSSRTSASNGGSGGGGNHRYSLGGSATQGSGSGYTGYGNAGGNAIESSSTQGSGGGGGAGAAGTNSYLNGGYGAGGNGGNGLSTWSTWGSATSSGENVSGTYYFAGGGGGASQYTTGGSGGLGGGGRGTTSNTSNQLVTDAQAGTANTGGGAGGSRGTAFSGGSGIVLLKIAGSKTASSTTGSPTRYETGGYTYYKFTGNGTIAF
jgi:fibronectin-binding autotransporter adhesin